MKFNGEKVLRVRHGYGRVFQVQTKAGAQYQDCRRGDLTLECYEDAEALDKCTPRALPEYVELKQ